MKKYDDKARLGHIYDAIIKIEKYISGVEKTVFLQNDILQDAVMRQVEIIGEASSRILDEMQEKHPN